MNIKVKFFEDKIVNAVGAGIYEIYAQTDSKEGFTCEKKDHRTLSIIKKDLFGEESLLTL